MSEAARRTRFLLRYLVLVGLPLAGLLLILAAGSRLPTAGLASPAAPPEPANLPLELSRLLLQIIVIIAVARLAGRALALLGQPRVVGEMAAGILLGPSVLGALAPGAFAALFAPGSVRFLNALSQVGVLLFMFVVGLQLDAAHLKGRGRTAILVSHASIATPLFLGAALALLLYPRLGTAGVSFTAFALFVGAAMSVTAFPVLARILAERGLTRTPLGTVAIACAAIDDVSAWCILAAVVAVAGRRAGTPLWLTLAGTAAWAAFVLTLGRAFLRRMADRLPGQGRLSQDMLALILFAALASAWVTESLGVHALFGAFLVGAVVPRRGPLVPDLTGRIEDVLVVLLLPLFFAFTGLRTRIGLIQGPGVWLLCGAVVLVAVAGKLGGSAVAARASGMRWRESVALGALLNTRGLMELVILNVGLDIGVISPVLFTMMVLMALLTTFMTTPLLAWLAPAAELRVAGARAA